MQQTSTRLLSGEPPGLRQGLGFALKSGPSGAHFQRLPADDTRLGQSDDLLFSKKSLRFSEVVEAEK